MGYVRLKAEEVWQKTQDSLTRLAYMGGIDITRRAPLGLVPENTDWAINWVMKYLCRGVNALHSGTADMTWQPGGLCGRVVHFGTRDVWLAWQRRISPSNRIVITCLHGEPANSPDMERSLNRFLDTVPRLSAVIASSRVMAGRLVEWGVPRGILHRIPLGVDTALFVPPTKEQRRQARRTMGLPDEAICIGSFQKDGLGWGEGMEPKLIKGPDVFVDAVARLNRDFPVFVLLSGPSRGYVKKRLEEQGIPYSHRFLNDYREIVNFYHALDIYIVSSREEGGPLAIVESMATGTPFVSTEVGMAPEVVRHRENGMLAPSEDSVSLADSAATVLADEGLRSRVVEQGLKDVGAYDWDALAKRYFDEVYMPLLDTLGKAPSV